MTIQELHTQLKQKVVDSLYIFTGPEIAVQNIYINQIAKIKGLDILRPDSITDIYSKLQNTSFLSKDYVYVIRDDLEYMKSEELQKKLPSIVKNNVIIFCYSETDKRTKFYKNHKESFIQFDYLEDRLLDKYIAKDIELNERNRKILMNICRNDYSRILLEIDKIKQYSQAVNQDVNKSFMTLLEDETIFVPPNDAIFELVDNILRFNIDKSFELLEQCKAIGESTLAILSVLYNNTKQVLQVQSYNGDNLSKATGLSSFQIKCAKEKVGNYPTGDLVYLMRLIQRVEVAIKTGKIEESIAMNYLLVNLFNV